QQAPPLGGAAVFASFVVRLVDLRGNTVDASFTHPVTLTFTIPASALPEDADEGTLMLSFWNGTAWVIVPATATLNEDGSMALVAEVSHFTLFQVTGTPDDWGLFTPALRPTGVTFSVWNGGSLEVFGEELAGATAWLIVEGRWLTYSVASPAFVN